MAKSILFGSEVLTKLLAGVNRIAEPVKASLGPNGRNTIYERVGNNQPVSSRDGVTIAAQIDASDPYENIGVETIKGVAREAVDQSGDGTTTATLLAQAIFAEGVKAISVGANPVALKQGIERAVAEVVARLKEMAIPVSGDMIRQVATISANNDEFLGKLIASAMERTGEDGVVTVEISRKPESELEVVDGLQIGTGYISHYFVTNPERNECVLEDAYVLLWEKKLATILPASKLLQEIAKEGKSLLVIAEDVTDEALGVLALAAQQKRLRCCAVKTPGGVEHLHDIGALTKGQVFTELLGLGLKDATLTHLGQAKKVIVRPQTTTIVAVPGTNPRLDQRISELRSQVAAANDNDKLRLQSRLARLSGGIAVIKVGAMTELEMLERKDRIEDAMYATRAAMKEGVLPGGGVALLRAKEWIEDDDIGGKIVDAACMAPIRTLAANSGKSADYIIEKIWGSSNPNYGWNAKTDQYEDLVAAGVLDPLRVVRVALESAASVAGLLLITATLVANERNK